MDLWTTAQLVLGLGLLVLGAELLVRGAAALAAAAGMSTLVTGLTIVAYGTSAPELAVSTQAAVASNGDIALGNVVGSNIFNVLFILGICALVLPLRVAVQLVRVDVPIMIAASIALWLLAVDGTIGRIDALLLLGAFVAYTGFVVRQSRRERREAAAAPGRPTAVPGARRHWLRVVRNLVLCLGGLAVLVLGARWLVDGAVATARALGVSDLVIGLTIIAAGTSMPELATSVVATLRAERDIAVGNVVGSNIFNILAIVGVAGMVAPGGLAVAPAAVGFDVPVMTAVAVACLPIFFTGHVIARWEGGLFFGYYVAYTLYLLLAAAAHDALALFSTVMLWFVLPITVLTLAVVAGRALRSGPGR